jgi:hypothetical protein
MTDSEKRLLIALVLMVEQYLHRYGNGVDSLAESAGEHAMGHLRLISFPHAPTKFTSIMVLFGAD